MAIVVLNNEVTTVNGNVSQLNISSEGILTLNDDTQNWIDTATFGEFLDADDTKYVLVKFKLSPDTASSSTQAAIKWECDTPPSTNIVPLIGYDPTQNKFYLNNYVSLKGEGVSTYNVTLTTTEWVYVRATKTGTTSYELTLEQPLNTQLATVTSGPALYSYFRFVGQTNSMVCEVDLLGSGLYNSDGTIATPLATLEEATPHIEINSTIPTAMYMGTTEVGRAYLGSTLVFKKASPAPTITLNTTLLGTEGTPEITPDGKLIATVQNYAAGNRVFIKEGVFNGRSTSSAPSLVINFKFIGTAGNNGNRTLQLIYPGGSASNDNLMYITANASGSLNHIYWGTADIIDDINTSSTYTMVIEEDEDDSTNNLQGFLSPYTTDINTFKTNSDGFGDPNNHIATNGYSDPNDSDWYLGGGNANQTGANPLGYEIDLLTSGFYTRWNINNSARVMGTLVTPFATISS